MSMKRKPTPVLVRRGDGRLSDAALYRRVEEGSLAPVLPGVYLRPDLVADWRWRAEALNLWRPGAVLIDEAAAALTFWQDLPVSTVRAATKTTLRRPGFEFVRRTVPDRFTQLAGAARITHPAMTALDLALATDGESIDQVLRSRAVRLADVQHACEATTHRRGHRARRRLLLDSRAEPWSVAERIAHTVLRAARIEGWRANVPIRIAGHLYYLDIAITGIKFVIEIDGRLFHSESAVFESDRIRQNGLVLAGWTVLRFTYSRLVTEPDAVAAEVKAGIALATERAANRR